MSLHAKFHLKQTILIFWTRFAQNGIFGPKQKKPIAQRKCCRDYLNEMVIIHNKMVSFKNITNKYIVI